jgi:hypothetical protein
MKQNEHVGHCTEVLVKKRHYCMYMYLSSCRSSSGCLVHQASLFSDGGYVRHGGVLEVFQTIYRTDVNLKHFFLCKKC